MTAEYITKSNQRLPPSTPSMKEESFFSKIWHKIPTKYKILGGLGIGLGLFGLLSILIGIIMIIVGVLIVIFTPFDRFGGYTALVGFIATVFGVITAMIYSSVSSKTGMTYREFTGFYKLLYPAGYGYEVVKTLFS